MSGVAKIKPSMKGVDKIKKIAKELIDRDPSLSEYEALTKAGKEYVEKISKKYTNKVKRKKNKKKKNSKKSK